MRQIGITNSLATKLWALGDSLYFVVANNFTHPNIEIDFSILIQFLSGVPSPKHSLCSLVVDYRELM